MNALRPQKGPPRIVSCAQSEAVLWFRLPILQNDEYGSWVERTAEGLDKVLEQLEYHIAES